MLVCGCGVTFTRRDNLLRHVQTKCEPQRLDGVNDDADGATAASPPFGPFDDETQVGEDGSATASGNQVTEVAEHATVVDENLTHIVGLYMQQSALAEKRVI
jgi:hypothetical protein